MEKDVRDAAARKKDKEEINGGHGGSWSDDRIKWRRDDFLNPEGRVKIRASMVFCWV